MSFTFDEDAALRTFDDLVKEGIIHYSDDTTVTPHTDNGFKVKPHTTTPSTTTPQHTPTNQPPVRIPLHPLLDQQTPNPNLTQPRTPNPSPYLRPILRHPPLPPLPNPPPSPNHPHPSPKHLPRLPALLPPPNHRLNPLPIPTPLPTRYNRLLDPPHHPPGPGELVRNVQLHNRSGLQSTA